MKLQDTQKLFSIYSKVDSKKKINRHQKEISDEILKQIDGGVTLEFLDELKNKGIPIFKYQTQITIHGIFGSLKNNYSYGYKFLFQNQNKSIGIKYGAIDEEKRRRIAKKLQILGFGYNRNSTSSDFEIIKRSFEIDSAKQDFEDLKKIASTINKDLFYGGYIIQRGSYMGAIYHILTFTINAIYEKNIDPLMTGMGLTPDVVSAHEEKLRLKAEERELKYQKQERERELKRQKTAQELNALRTSMPYQKEVPVQGNVYLEISADWSGEIGFKILKLKPKGRNKFDRISMIRKESLSEAIESIKDLDSYMADEKIVRKELTPKFLIQKNGVLVEAPKCKTEIFQTTLF